MDFPEKRGWEKVQEKPELDWSRWQAVRSKASQGGKSRKLK